MKWGKMFVVLLFLIVTIGVVSATEEISDDAISNFNDNPIEITNDTISDVQKSVDENMYQENEISYTFSDLNNDINASGDTFEIEHDYKFNNQTDTTSSIIISKNNFVINGNGHTIDANNQNGIFDIEGCNVTVNNLTFINANSYIGSVFMIGAGCSLTTNNVVFENNTAVYGIIASMQAKYFSNNDKFIDSVSDEQGLICLFSSEVTLNNALMRSSKELLWGFIKSVVGFPSTIRVFNSTFANTTSKYSTAIEAGEGIIVENCKFINLHATQTAGAIGLKNVSGAKIKGCTFINVTSQKNGGVLFADLYDNITNDCLVEISNCNFVDCYSGFGGAILQLAGNLTISDCNFTNNHAVYDGGVIYTSWSLLNISDSVFNNNYAQLEENRVSCGGAIYCDNSTCILNDCEFTNNFAEYGGAIGLYDTNYDISNNKFKDNVNFDGDFDDIFTVFERSLTVLGNNSYSGDNSLSLNNVDYATIVNATGEKFVLINNTIDVSSLPSRFDLRDWGWVTSVKNQGDMGACWTFGASGAMEISILRYVGIEMDLSEDNMQDVSLQFSKYGVVSLIEGAYPINGANYVLSWLGVFPSEYDTYDELGKISPIITKNSIHFQDVVMIPTRKNSTDNDLLKEAILKYGGAVVTYYGVTDAPYVNKDTAAQYCNESMDSNHGVLLVGWDDNFSKENFLITPPGDGAWIIKNSWGTKAGDNGFYYISYYDLSFATIDEPYFYLLFNTEQYNKNYQYGIQGFLYYNNDSSEYSSKFVAVDDDLIAGVGTFFNETNVEYEVEVYVNGELKLVQNGVSPFRGYHTIQLDSFVPIKKGDEFAVKVKSNAVPCLSHSRHHFIEGVSYYLKGGSWIDAYDENTTCCIKAYTVADDTKIINNKNISVDYAGGKYFSVAVVTANGHAVGAGEKVKFKINGKTKTVTTDKNGIAKIKITDIPKKYTITTTYKGKSIKNTVTVKQVLTTSKVTIKKTAKKLVLKAKLKINGKLAKGKKITFKFNGKTYTAKTNSKGIAQKTLKKSVINKLKKGKTYSVKVTYIKDTIKSTVKVK